LSTPPGTLTDPQGNKYVLRGETFSEKIVIDSYTAAATGALSAVDGVADKITTAGFSVATAYAAVIALVAPKDSRSPVLVVLPFLFLAAAVVCALIAQAVKVPLDATDSTTEIRNRITSTVSRKRRWLWGALAALVVGLGLAGGAVYETSGPGAETSSTTTVSIWLTSSGTRLVTDACGKASTPFTGDVADTDALSASTVPLIVTRAQCPKGAGTLVLPRRAIATSKY
jgi:MFS family permease